MIDGIFACGNVLQVHDLVDFVSEEAETAGVGAAEYVLYGNREKDVIDCKNGQNVSYVLPQKIDRNQKGIVKLYFRVTNTFKNCVIKLKSGEKVLTERKKRIAVPGEMESFLLTEELLAAVNGEIELSLEC